MQRTRVLCLLCLFVGLAYGDYHRYGKQPARKPGQCEEITPVDCFVEVFLLFCIAVVQAHPGEGICAEELTQCVIFAAPPPVRVRPSLPVISSKFPSSCL